MKYQFNEINSRSLWDTFVTTHSPQSLFQSWSWGNVQERLGSTIWRFGLYKQQDLVAVVAVYKMTSRRGSYLHARHGPVFKHFNFDDYKCILEELKQLAKTEHASYVRLSPLVDSSSVHLDIISSLRCVFAPINEIDAERCWVLDINKSDDQLLNGMRKSTRYDIRRAQKEHVVIRSTSDPSKLSTFFDLYKQTSERHKFVGHKGIQEEFDEFSKSKSVVYIEGIHEEKVKSAAIVLFYGNQAIYHHGASIHSTIPVSSFLQWNGIQIAKKRNMSVYNFWGISPANDIHHPWNGISTFKKGFGGREVVYLHAHDYPIDMRYTVIRAIETIRRRMKGFA